MTKQEPYKIEYAREAIDHLEGFSVPESTAVLDGVEKQLRHQPTLATRTRAPMRSNALAAYRLRIGKLRVLYVPERGCPCRVDTDILHAVGVWGGPGGPRSQRLRGDY